MRNRRVLIVGAGIGGLVLGIKLKKLGLAPHLIEKTVDWTPKGAGIHLYSNALRALDSIDVAEEIAEQGSSHDDYLYSDAQDQHAVRVTYPRLAGPNLPALSLIKRTTLHKILVNRAKKVGLTVQLGTTVKELQQEEGPVHVRFSNGKESEYDIVVAADGIYSQIRTQVIGDTPPKYTGQAIWRVLLPRHEDSTEPKIMFSGGGTMFGMVPLDKNEVYLLCGQTDLDKPRYEADIMVETIKERFGHFGGLAPHYLDLIKTSEQLTYTSIEEIHLPAPWFRKNIIFIGDAAHASSPYMAQGAAMAIEDAIVLGELINQELTTNQIADAYMKRRYERAGFIQKKSIERNKNRYQGGSYESKDGAVSERMLYLKENAQREIDEIYSFLAEPI